MRLLIHDTLATAPFTFPLSANWLSAPIETVTRPQLRAADIEPDDVALIPSSEIAMLQETHHVVPDIAIIASEVGLVTMRTPVRPDEINHTPVRLWDASGAAELLSRAVLQPFYGILPIAWSDEDSADAQVVIVEGVTALQSPEAGFAEDLVRAWCLLTEQPFVSHVLIAPRSSDRTVIAPALEYLESARAISHERRRDLRRSLVEQHDLDRKDLTDVLNAQRYHLDASDRRALLMLLQKGNRGSTYPYVWDLSYL